MPITKKADWSIKKFLGIGQEPKVLNYDPDKNEFLVQKPDGTKTWIHEKVWNAQNRNHPGLLGTLGINAPKVVGAMALTGAALTVHKKYKEIENDSIRKRLIEELIASDPVLQSVDREQVLEWYATIYHFAPQFSLDKMAVKEVLENFARFGRVDVNTLKMLSETEKARNQAQDIRSELPWHKAITDLARTVSFGD